MFEDLFESGVLLDLPLIGMLGFMALFFGAVIWACSKRRKPHFDRMARLPLHDCAPDRGHHEEIRNG